VESTAVDPVLNTAVERYYDTTLDLYEELWGEHVHHGFWDPGEAPGSGGADRKKATDRLVTELVDYARLPHGARILDVGCGIGGPALHLAGALGAHIEGVTLSASQAARATEKAAEAGLSGRTRFQQLDGLSTGFPDGSFDAVWAVESLMHIPDRPAFFAEMFRLLRPGGTLAIATWSQRDGELSAEDEKVVKLVLKHQVMPSFSSLEDHVRMARTAGFSEVAFADWSSQVANSWDPEFAMIERFENGKGLMRDLARERGVDVLGFFYAGPLMLKGFQTGAITYGAVRATKPVAPGAELVAEVAELLRASADVESVVEAGTRLDGDLELESVEIAGFATALRERYGDRVDLPGYIAGLEVDEIVALSVADVAAHVAARLAPALTAPYADPVPSE
jgi:tocopherol O-methyltransferase